MSARTRSGVARGHSMSRWIAGLAIANVISGGALANASPCGAPCGPTRASVPVPPAADDDEAIIEMDVDVDVTADPPGVQRVRGSTAPAIGDVLEAAYTAAGLDRDPARGWVRRARIAGVVPWITVRTGRDTSWHDDDPAIGHGTALEIRATWRLDRLVFDGRELQVASIEAARRRERRRLASRVIRTYFTWQRAARAAQVGSSVPSGAMSRAEEAAAELDALTDGWFSDELAVPRRTASETRTPHRTR